MTKIEITNAGHVVKVTGNCPESLTSLLKMMSVRYEQKKTVANAYIDKAYAPMANSDQFIKALNMAYGIEAKRVEGVLFTCADIPVARQKEVVVSVGKYFFIVTNKKTGEKVVVVGERMNDALTQMGLKASEYKLGGDSNRLSITRKLHLYTELSKNEVAKMPYWNSDYPIDLFVDEGGAEYGVTQADKLSFCREEHRFVVWTPERDW